VYLAVFHQLGEAASSSGSACSWQLQTFHIAMQLSGSSMASLLHNTLARRSIGSCCYWVTHNSYYGAARHSLAVILAAAVPTVVANGLH
jgi:hypothetical protein